MPLYKTLIPNSQTTVKIWKITESYEDLLNNCVMNESSLLRVNNMKSELHQRGFLSVRHILSEFGYTDFDLYYDENGKPHLKDGNYISITHSFIFSAIAISENPIGIDIEKQREKIGRIAHKFMDYEFNYLNGDDFDYIQKFTIVWCVKESLYKLFAKPGLSFMEHTLVIPFTLEEASTIAWIDYKNKKYRYHAEFLEFEGFTCAYTMP